MASDTLQSRSEASLPRISEVDTPTMSLSSEDEDEDESAEPNRAWTNRSM